MKFFTLGRKSTPPTTAERIEEEKRQQREVQREDSARGAWLYLQAAQLLGVGGGASDVDVLKTHKGIQVYMAEKGITADDVLEFYGDKMLEGDDESPQASGVDVTRQASTSGIRSRKLKKKASKA